MRIAVLDLCHAPPEFMTGQPSFGLVLRDWVARGLPTADYSVIDIAAGAALPEVSTYDAFVVSGSDKGVYDDTDWMEPLRSFLLAARDAGKPLLGVCFGHQIMADTFGGKAEKVGDPQVGVRSYDLNGISVEAHAWHQDQVTRVPPGARVFASAPYCPVAGLWYDFPAVSVQFHPEYSADYIGGFMSRGRGEVLSEEATDRALAELSEGSVDPALFASEAGAFFRAALGVD